MSNLRYVKTHNMDWGEHTQSLSNMTTVSAAVRLIPRPPALVLRRKRKTSGSEENFFICTEQITHVSLWLIHLLQEQCIYWQLTESNTCTAYILLSVCVSHAPIQSTVLISTEITVVHQDVQNRCHLAENQDLRKPPGAQK